MNEVVYLILQEMKRIQLIIEEEGPSSDAEMALRHLAAKSKNAANELQHLRHYGCHSSTWRGVL